MGWCLIFFLVWIVMAGCDLAVRWWFDFFFLCVDLLWPLMACSSLVCLRHCTSIRRHSKAAQSFSHSVIQSQKLIEERPPGGACTRVEGRSVMTLPQFWLAPLEYALEVWVRLAGALALALAAGAMLVLVLTFIGSTYEPKLIWERPPAGACTRVEGRSVRTLPQFWLAPFEYLLEETFLAGALDAPKQIWERPPAGACTRVEGRSVRTLPQFWLAPLEYLLEETFWAGALDAPKLI
jgi:hypothetical protein